MARTLYFMDGSQEVLFCDGTEKLVDDLERIIREHLGNDCAGLFCEIVEEHKDVVSALEDELKGYRFHANNE